MCVNLRCSRVTQSYVCVYTHGHTHTLHHVLSHCGLSREVAMQRVLGVSLSCVPYTSSPLLSPHARPPTLLGPAGLSSVCASVSDVEIGPSGSAPGAVRLSLCGAFTCCHPLRVPPTAADAGAVIAAPGTRCCSDFDQNSSRGDRGCRLPHDVLKGGLRPHSCFLSEAVTPSASCASKYCCWKP